MDHLKAEKIRLRRNRKTDAIRSLVRETRLSIEDFLVPFFVMEGTSLKSIISSFPGIHRYSIDLLIDEVRIFREYGIRGILLFPVIPREEKSEGAEEAWNEIGLIPRAVRALKEHFPDLLIFTDVALDPYTSHGHDGFVDPVTHQILNDETVEGLVKMALVHARSGADFVSPSDMMDGRVGAIRRALDQEGFSSVGILAYSAKYASALYGPYRDALHVQLAFGDKKSYHLDPSNRREAMLEALKDEEEGADILMVKPATLYLDVIADLRKRTERPLAAFHVSGEYAMVMAAHERGVLDAARVFYETLLSIKRAGADFIISYAVPLVLPLINSTLR